MSTKRVLLAIFALLSLLPFRHAKAQNQQPLSTGTQSSASAPSPHLQQRTTFTVKYTPIFLGNARRFYPAVTGLFPNHHPSTFVIDTGTDAMLISENLARGLDLPTYPSPDPNQLIMDGKVLKQTVLPDFVLEALPASPLLPQGKPLQHLRINGYVAVIPQHHWDFIEAEGVVGTNLLRKVGAVMFDGPKQQLTLLIGGNLSAAEREQVGFSAMATSIGLTPTGKDNSGGYTIPVTLENNGISQNVALIVDTGSNITMIPRKAALALRLELTSIPSTFIGLSGMEKTSTSSVETIEIGDLVLHDTRVYFPSDDEEAPATIQAKGAITDRLGMNVLAGYRVLLDFSAHMMYLMPAVPEVAIPTK